MKIPTLEQRLSNINAYVGEPEADANVKKAQSYYKKKQFDEGDTLFFDIAKKATSSERDSGLVKAAEIYSHIIYSAIQQKREVKQELKDEYLTAIQKVDADRLFKVAEDLAARLKDENFTKKVTRLQIDHYKKSEDVLQKVRAANLAESIGEYEEAIQLHLDSDSIDDKDNAVKVALKYNILDSLLGKATDKKDYNFAIEILNLSKGQAAEMKDKELYTSLLQKELKIYNTIIEDLKKEETPQLLGVLDYVMGFAQQNGFKEEAKKYFKLKTEVEARLRFGEEAKEVVPNQNGLILPGSKEFVDTAKKLFI